MKIFWWQVSWDIIPAEENLARHHIPTPQVCPLCGFAKAGTIHVLFHCPLVKNTWSYFNILIPNRVVETVNTIDYLEHLFHLNWSWPKENLVAIAWAIWKKRCEILHNDTARNKPVKPLNHYNVEWALRMVEEYQQACSKELGEPSANTQRGLSRAIKLMGPGLLVFSDASFNIENGDFSTGVVVTNERGKLLDFRLGQKGKAESPLEAEIVAMLEGVKAAKELGGSKILILSDCFEAVKAVNENESFWSRGGYTLKLINKELLLFKEWKCLHLRREFNEAAHFLASAASSPTDSPDWVSNRVNLWIRELGSLLEH